MKITPLLFSLLAVFALAGCVNDTVTEPVVTPEQDTATVVPVPTPDNDMLFEEIPEEDTTGEELLEPDAANNGTAADGTLNNGDAADGTTAEGTTAGGSTVPNDTSDSDINNGLLDPGMNGTGNGTGAVTPDTASADSSLLENNIRNVATKENGVEDAVVVVSGGNRCLVALKMKQGETLTSDAAQNIRKAVGDDYETKITTETTDYSGIAGLRANGQTVDDNAFTDFFERIKAAF